MKSLMELMFPRGIDAIPPEVMGVEENEESEDDARDYRLYHIARVKRGDKYVYELSYADRYGYPYSLPPETVDENGNSTEPVSDDESPSAETVFFMDAALHESEQRREYKEAMGRAKPEI